jgi:hypothetical protein
MIKKPLINLRQVYNQFVAPTSIIEENDATMIAEQADFIIDHKTGHKFYLIRKGGSETKRTFCTDPDCVGLKAHGFIALLKDHPNYPKHRQLFAFQCDECKLFYIMNIPKQVKK